MQSCLGSHTPVEHGSVTLRAAAMATAASTSASHSSGPSTNFQQIYSMISISIRSS